MLVLIFSISLVIAIVSTILWSKVSYSLKDLFFGFAIVGYAVAIIVLIIFIFMIPEVATAERIDEKIAMCEEENARIEAQIAPVIEDYMKYEQETFANLKPEESLITFATFYPDELKSNEMVQWQLEVYLNNRDKIRTLKEEKIDMKTDRWILFFGK